MFAAIAGRYDVANAVLSLGIHHRWRKEAVRASGVAKGGSVLDCATGTGDLALSFKRAVGPAGHVLATDFCAPMLRQAPKKATAAGLQVGFGVADAQLLPFPPGRFDVVSIAFGIRNVENPRACLQELARVVRAGGRVVVLEFGQPTGAFGAAFSFYSRQVLPRLGGLISGRRDAYEYLDRTAAAFPAGERFLALMRETGAFRDVEARRLTLGTAWVYVGTV